MIEIVRLLLAAVLALAAIGKLADREGSRRALRAFGAPTALVPALALLLPCAELAIAAGLVPGASARLAAVGAAALLALFAGAIAMALARGRRPDCGCFGRLHSAPVGWTTVARNTLLAAVALLVVSQPASDPTWVELVVTGVILIVSVQAVLSFVLLRRYGKALRRIEELEARPALAVGAHAPRFDGLDELLARRRPVLLVFSEPDCPACRLLEPQVEVWKRELEDRLTVAVVDAEARTIYGAEATPSAALVGADGRIAHALVEGRNAIEELVESLALVAEPAHAAANGRARVATAAALAGGLTVTAAVTASAAQPSRQGLDPELKAIDDLLRSWAPRLAAASRRSAKAIRAQATLKTGKAVRTNRAAARKALAAERQEVLRLRAAVDRLPETTAEAQNVKTMVHSSAGLMAQSLQKRRRLIGAQPKLAQRLLNESQRLFIRSCASSMAAGKLLGRG